MKQKRMHKWFLTFGGVGAFIGIGIGNLISGGLDAAVLLGGFTAFVIMFTIDLIRMRMKKDKTPDFDERTQHNLTKYYAVSANIFIALLFMSLAVGSLMGTESVTLTYLAIPFFTYLFLSGIGAIIVMRK